MPEIPVGAQVFDLAFHPTSRVVFSALLSGVVKAFSYDEQGQYSSVFEVGPSKRPCRSLETSEDGGKLYAVGKGKSLHVIDTATGKVVDSRLGIHETAINRVKRLFPNVLATGDDDGVVKLFDTRSADEVRTYSHHVDFISDFLWIENKKHLVATSGDGTLSVIDARSSKLKPVAQSEDQEDELLSIVPIRKGTKTVVGTQLGILSIFNRGSGWGDCVDRVPGHPHSIDALCNIPDRYPNAESTILTGSSDGLLRAVQLMPTKVLGVVADHGEFPIERIAVDLGGQGQWVASVGHDEILRLTDLRAVFEDAGSEGSDADSGSEDESDSGDGQKGDYERWDGIQASGNEEKADKSDGSDDDTSDSGSPEPQPKRKRKEDTGVIVQKKVKSNGTFNTAGDPSFFSGL